MTADRYRARLAALALLIFASTACLPGQEILLPSHVSACLAKHSEVELNREQQPPYLKVRFSAERPPDYLVAVVYSKTHASRALLCRSDGSTQVLGVPGAEPFSDMYNDDYMSSEWRVCPKTELQHMTKSYRGVPPTDNQAVCLTWEDAESLIYERGGRMLWKNLTP